MTDPVEKNEPVAWFEVYEDGDDAEYQMVGAEWNNTGNTVPLYSASTVEALKAENAALLSRVERQATALTEIAQSDDIDNALDPERNKRLARAALQEKSHD